MQLYPVLFSDNFRKLKLMLAKKKRRKCLFILLTISVSFCLLVLYALIIEPNRFVVTRHQLNQQITSNKNSFKIVQISDLHLKQFNNRAQRIAEQVNKLNPNIVLFTGDSIDRVEQLDGFDRFLSLLDKQTAKGLARKENTSHSRRIGG
ncbi:metallophosphoesterase, partial [Nostoc sp. CALU 1950]|uniref:metallophosphoesterase n=1 Tax=Nostoc sp. CALU 1950 TaxID=3104321 RepID=UPI003EBFEA41